MSPSAATNGKKYGGKSVEDYREKNSSTVRHKKRRNRLDLP